MCMDIIFLGILQGAYDKFGQKCHLSHGFNLNHINLIIFYSTRNLSQSRKKIFHSMKLPSALMTCSILVLYREPARLPVFLSVIFLFSQQIRCIFFQSDSQGTPPPKSSRGRRERPHHPLWPPLLRRVRIVVIVHFHNFLVFYFLLFIYYFSSFNRSTKQACYGNFASKPN